MYNNAANTLKIKELGIDTYRENIIFMHADSHICISEGFTALTRVRVLFGDKSIVATLNVVYSDMLSNDQAGLSIEAMKRLAVKEGDVITVLHLGPIESLGYIRGKMYGKVLVQKEFDAIISDVVSGHYSNIELAAFISACSGDNLSINEITALTKAMISCSKKLSWGREIILDKHCVGGLPGNRTTPIVVSILAAAGLIIPKTSSRAITSPSGTSDTMEVMTPVNLSIEEIKRVVEKENGCITWGGAVKLSPADDILISVERSLDIDCDGQMIASVLSKKVAAGSTHVLIDIPMGETAKVRSRDQALKLQYHFKAVGEAVGLNVEVLITDGRQPVGRGIGPSLEAIDVLSVLRNEKDAPADLRQRAIQIAIALLELSGKYQKGAASVVANNLLLNGKALEKFMSICKAQGGFKEPQLPEYIFDVVSEKNGVVKNIDNRKLARIAKLAGAPKSTRAGIRFLSPIGSEKKKGDVLFTVFAEAVGELEYVKKYIGTISNLITIE